MSIKPEQTRDEQAAYWHIAMREPLSHEEQQNFELWLENEENRHEYEAFLQVESLFKTLPKETKQNLVHETTPAKKRLTLSWKPLAVAATVILACIGMFEAYAYTQFMRMHEIQTAYESREIVLPDASKVRMDASTKLSITYYNGKREVILTQGQATFEVTKDEKRPFIVKNPQLDTRVVGTCFSVSFLDDLSSIYVLNGSVQVNESVNHTLLATLGKGESLMYDGKKARVLFVKPFDTNKFALWTKGMIAFDKTPLEQALRSFERYNDLAFITPRLDTSSFFVTGSFQTKDVDKFLVALRNIYAFKIEKNEKQIVISSKSGALKE